MYTPGQRLWRSGSTVNKSFIIVAGTVSFVPKRRNGGSSARRIKQEHEMQPDPSHENVGAELGNAQVVV